MIFDLQPSTLHPLMLTLIQDTPRGLTYTALTTENDESSGMR